MEEYELVIVIMACYTKLKYKNEILMLNNTWVKKCEDYKNIKVLYFLGEQKIDKFVDTKNVKYINLKGVQDDYFSATYKQFLGLKYIKENYKTKFIIAVGTDTYLNIPKLLLYINKFDYTENLYIGGHGCERQIGSKKYYFHSGGPGFIITYECLIKLYNILPTLINDWINTCNINNIQYLIPCCDVAIAYYLQQPNINSKIIKTNDLSFLHCNYQGNPCHINQVDMSKIIACHNMNKIDFNNFTNILIMNNFFV
jgi:hypothetical protein